MLLLAKDSNKLSIQQLPIAVYSDFSNMQERLLPIQIPHHITTIDAYSTSYGTISTLLTARGQTFLAPVIPDIKSIPQAGMEGEVETCPRGGTRLLLVRVGVVSSKF